MFVYPVCTVDVCDEYGYLTLLHSILFKFHASVGSTTDAAKSAAALATAASTTVAAAAVAAAAALADGAMTATASTNFVSV